MAPKSKGLGRGLSSLLGEPVADAPLANSTKARDRSTGKTAQIGAENGQSVQKSAGTAVDAQPVVVQQNGPEELAIELLHAGKFQPRQSFDDAALTELADSIREQGLLQPIVVRPSKKTKGSFEIVAGERRWRAAQKAGLHQVAVIKRDFDDVTTLEISILENVQREDLSPIEEARGYQRLVAEFGFTNEHLAQRLGKSRPYIANALRLLKLPESVLGLLAEKKLSAGHARTLIGLEPVQAEAVADRIIVSGLSVRDAEKIVRDLANDGEENAKRPTQKSFELPDPNLRALEQTLESRLGMRVAVKQGRGEQGQISFSYKSFDQLDALLARLR